jgi:hypothetical protein
MERSVLFFVSYTCLYGPTTHVLQQYKKSHYTMRWNWTTLKSSVTDEDNKFEYMLCYSTEMYVQLKGNWRGITKTHLEDIVSIVK